MASESGMDVLIMGASEIGAEVVEHMLKAGTKSITVHDNSKISNEFASVKLVTHLREIRPKSNLSAHVGELSFEFLHNFDLVIMVGSHPRSEVERVNSYCRCRRRIDEKGRIESNPAGFVAADIRGVAMYVMIDYCEKFFSARPVDSLSIFRAHVIGARVKDKKTLIKVSSDIPRNLKRGTFTFTGIQKHIKAISSSRPYKITSVADREFAIDVQSNPGECKRFSDSKAARNAFSPKAVNVQQHIDAPTINFSSLRRRWRTNLGMDKKSAILHLAFQSVLSFQQKYNRWPKSSNEDAKEVLSIAVKCNDQWRKQIPSVPVLEKKCKEFIKNIVMQSGVEIAPLCSMVGSIVARESLKFRSMVDGKPIQETFLSLSSDLLSKLNLDSKETKTVGGDEKVIEGEDSKMTKKVEGKRESSLFGSGIGAHNLRSLKVLVIANDNLAFSLLKHLAKLGVGSSKSGSVTFCGLNELKKVSRETKNVKEKLDELSCDTSQIQTESFRSILVNSGGREGKPFDVIIAGIENGSILGEAALRWLTVDIGNLCSMGIVIHNRLGRTNASVDIVVGDEKRKEIPSIEGLVNNDGAITSLWRQSFSPANLSECISFACEEANKLFVVGPRAAKEYIGEAQGKELKVSEPISGNDTVLLGMISAVQDCMKRHKKLKNFEECVLESSYLYRKLFCSDIKDNNISLRKYCPSSGIFKWTVGGPSEVDLENKAFGRKAWSVTTAVKFPKGYPSGSTSKEWLLTLGQLADGGLRWQIDGGLLVIGCWGNTNVMCKVPEGGEHSFVATWDGEKLSVYIDGKFSQSKTNVAFDLTSTKMTICKAPVLIENGSRACVQSVRVYNECLNERDIASLHRCLKTDGAVRLGTPLGALNIHDPVVFSFISSTAHLLSIVHGARSPGDVKKCTMEELEKMLSDAKGDIKSSSESKTSESCPFIPAAALGKNIYSSEENTKEYINRGCKLVNDTSRIADVIDELRQNMVTTCAPPSKKEEKKNVQDEKKITLNGGNRNTKPMMPLHSIFDITTPDNDESSELQMQFIWTVACLRARCFGLGMLLIDQCRNVIQRHAKGPDLSGSAAAGHAILSVIT